MAHRAPEKDNSGIVSTILKFLGGSVTKILVTTLATVAAAWCLTKIGPLDEHIRAQLPHEAEPEVGLVLKNQEGWFRRHTGASSAATATPAPVAQPARPDALAAAVAATSTEFGKSLSAAGLDVTVGAENFDPGCNGGLGFQIALHNPTSAAIKLHLAPSNLRFSWGTPRQTHVFARLGPQSADCYREQPSVSSVAAGETVLLAVRVMEQQPKQSKQAEFRFDGTGAPLEGLTWHLKVGG